MTHATQHFRPTRTMRSVAPPQNTSNAWASRPGGENPVGSRTKGVRSFVARRRQPRSSKAGGDPAFDKAMILYLDTSALVKLYIEEEGTDEVQSAARRQCCPR